MAFQIPRIIKGPTNKNEKWIYLQPRYHFWRISIPLHSTCLHKSSMGYTTVRNELNLNLLLSHKYISKQFNGKIYCLFSWNNFDLNIRRILFYQQISRNIYASEIIYIKNSCTLIIVRSISFCSTIFSLSDN